MPVSYLDHRFPTLAEYIDRQTRNRLMGADGTPLYAHPMDEWIIRSLKALALETLLDKPIETLISAQLGEYLATGIPIDEKSFPDLYAVLTRCATTLGIPIPHAVTQSSLVLFNAFTAGTDDYAFISITAGLSEFFTPDEAAFVIGHECGHIASKHMIYHTLVYILANIGSRQSRALAQVLQHAALPLLAWSRRSEITADRAGLLCCGDIAVAERALLRLIAGHANIDRVDIDDYLRRYKETEEYHGSGWQRLFTTHPLIPRRIAALRLFAHSELYYDLSGQPPPASGQLLSRAELDRRTQQIVKP